LSSNFQGAKIQKFWLLSAALQRGSKFKVQVQGHRIIVFHRFIVSSLHRLIAIHRLIVKKGEDSSPPLTANC
jgi:hypothetical protein